MELFGTWHKFSRHITSSSSWIEAASLIYSRVMTTKLGDETGCEEDPSALGTL